jgi:hypothetical protein
MVRQLKTFSGYKKKPAFARTNSRFDFHRIDICMFYKAKLYNSAETIVEKYGISFDELKEALPKSQHSKMQLSDYDVSLVAKYVKKKIHKERLDALNEASGF